MEGIIFIIIKIIYLKIWEEFEMRHGNEDTFKDLMRIKRSVA